MANPKAHPKQKTIIDFAHGLLNESTSDTVASHLEACETCCEALSRVPVDRFAMLARKASNLESSPASEIKSLSTSAPEPVAGSDDIPVSLQSLERYRVTERIGHGGMGEVYRAEHKLMDREVAIKVINPTFTGNLQAVSRFRNEVRAAAKLTHPNIVASFDAEKAGDVFFLAMELVEGETLAEFVQQAGPLPPECVLELARGVAAGLQAANQQGMIHRDIKPQNLMIEDQTGEVKILDFGLARFEREQLEIASVEPQTAALTGANVAIGTPDYLAPEQATNARQADIRTDIYSLGCTLYFALTGQPPFPGGSSAEKIAHHITSQPKRLEEVCPAVPKSLAQIVRRMMEKDPADRFQTPAEFLQHVDQLTNQRSANPMIIVDEKPIHHQKAKPPAATRRAWLLMISFVSLATLGMLAIGLMKLPSFLGLDQKPTGKVLVLASHEIFFWEFESVRQAFTRHEIEFTTASYEGMIRPVDETDLDLIKVDVMLNDVDPSRYDAVVFVGGHNEQLVGAGKHADQTQRIVSAICNDRNGVLAAMAGGEGILSQLGFDEILEGPNDLEGFEVFSAQGIVTATEPRFSDHFAIELLDAIKSRGSPSEN